MVKRRTNIVAAILAVTLGGFLYVLLRENTYIAKVFSDNQIVVLCRTAFVGQEWYAVSCYLPDFLWGFALSCSMIAVFEPSKVGCFCCALVGILCGSFWEALQTLRLVPGTGDIWDILMYVCAAAFAYLINIKERKK